MPWSLERRDGRWCVIKDSDGSVSGCHDSRANAIKQQRALYANESRVAAMYADLDANTEEWREPPTQSPPQAPSTLSPLATELVGLLLKDEREKSLIASLGMSMERIAEVVERQGEDKEALVAAIGQLPAPVVNVPAPVVNVEAPEVNVPPTVVNVEVPEITVPAANVTVEAAKSPDIHVTLPSSKRTVKINRDPLTGQMTDAEVTES